jgi:hypothetical protein
MSIGDMVIKMLTYLLQKFVLNTLPTSFPGLTIDNYTGFLNNVNSSLVFAYSRIGNFMPIGLILTCLIVVITAELTLLTFKAGIFVVNLVRGSGA